MKQQRRKARAWLLAVPVVMAAALIWFSAAVTHLEESSQAEGMRQLEDALRRAAVSCYAAEGIYPPDLAYITEHYGIQIDEEKYFIHYEAIAENLMPEIAVISQEQ